MLNRLKIPLYIQVLQVQKLKELSLPAVAEELSHNLNDSFTGKVNENMAKLKEKFNKSIIYYKKNAILYFILRNLKIFIIFAQ